MLDFNTVFRKKATQYLTKNQKSVIFAL